MAQLTAPAISETRHVERLLTCGIVAGPLFLAVVLLSAVTRDGYDLSRHPISLLSLGELGWIQIANFVVVGALNVACAVGMRRVLHPGKSGTWGPLLVGIFGAGLVIGGVFLTDAGAGFPPGAPPGAPEISWHGIVHEIGFGLSFLAMTAGCLVFVRRFASRRQWGWVAGCIVTVLAVLTLAGWPDVDGLSLRLLLASAILLGFVGAVAAYLIRGLPE
jgi:hypothetical membrane protein